MRIGNSCFGEGEGVTGGAIAGEGTPAPLPFVLRQISQFGDLVYKELINVIKPFVPIRESLRLMTITTSRVKGQKHLRLSCIYLFLTMS